MHDYMVIEKSKNQLGGGRYSLIYKNDKLIDSLAGRLSPQDERMQQMNCKLKVTSLNRGGYLRNNWYWEIDSLGKKKLFCRGNKIVRHRKRIKWIETVWHANGKKAYKEIEISKQKEDKDFFKQKRWDETGMLIAKFYAVSDIDTVTGFTYNRYEGKQFTWRRPYRQRYGKVYTCKDGYIMSFKKRTRGKVYNEIDLSHLKVRFQKYVDRKYFNPLNRPCSHFCFPPAGDEPEHVLEKVD